MVDDRLVRFENTFDTLAQRPAHPFPDSRSDTTHFVALTGRYAGSLSLKLHRF